jgi:tetratricopeptide (TPR) repeat protein
MQPIERAELLEKVEGLNKLRAFPELCTLLQGRPRELILQEPWLAYYLAVSWREVGRGGESLELLREVEHLVLPGENDRLLRRIDNLQGMLSIDSGNLADADLHFSAAFQSACKANDHLIAGLVIAHQGIVADIRCDWAQALICYHRSKGHWQILRDFLYIGLCNHNLGMTYRQLALVDEADACFRAAVRMFIRYGRPDDVCATEIERALLFSLRGESVIADKLITLALERTKRIRNKRMQAEALRVQGLIRLHETNYRDAQISLRRAARISRQLGMKMLRAEVQEALAAIDGLTGQSRNRLRRQRLAKFLYLQMGATARAGRVGADTGLSAPLVRLKSAASSMAKRSG